MRKHVLSLSLSIIFVFGISIVFYGCATKNWVQEELRARDARIGNLDSSIGENQAIIKEHEGKIANLSGETQKAIKDAQNAMTEAERSSALARGKLLYAVTLSNENVRFEFDSAILADTAKSILDEFFSMVVSENRNIFIEIHGHTDSTGPEEYNMILGLRRANAVKQYLLEKINQIFWEREKKVKIPIYRLSTISYGEKEPIADSSTREGRAENRRVVILVLE